MEAPHPRHRHQAGGFSDPPSPLSPPLSPATVVAAAAANARWTPTKEQIAVLEGLYWQGLRTPTAEQIQQITARLRQHGHIEGKNVFYWFQNHKARQRLKQKQQSFDYFSKLLRRPPPLPVLHRPLVRPLLPLPMPAAAMLPPPPSACNTGGAMCRPRSYMAAAASETEKNGGYYPQQEIMPVLYPGLEVSPHDKAISPVQPPPTTMYQTAPNGAHYAETGRGGGHSAGGEDGGPWRETLQLFPLQPTFVVPDDKACRGGGRACGTVSLSSPAPASFSAEWDESSDIPDGEAPPPFYDFFGIHSGGR
ncbi:hypothetical protein GUJ93_ZPchr0007g4569 [Zizania palustris]|uniref:Homeobox domain-containing protein n=1 Tax=Zizania palustris TaxID=103762 RepID=A0A8J5TIT7_ZIZPA|nr:hypothetical protein GUJ93_ZPchr0007g4569 [Zizania palustris]